MPVPDFSPGEVLTAAAMDSIGLWLVKTQTIGTGAATVVVNDAFSSTYDNYLITVNGGTSSATTFLSLRLGAAVSSYRWQYLYGSWNATPAADGASASDRFFYVGSSNVDGINMSCTVLSPNLAKGTRIIADATVSGSFSGNTTGLLVTTAQYTSFTLLPGSGTLTGGTIRVYGYRN